MGFRRRRTTDSDVRLFYASDVHGSERCWRKFLAAARVHRVDALVMGGDLTGKAIVPIIDQGSDVTAEFQGRQRRFRNESDVASFEEDVRVNGFYPYRCDSAEVERLGRDPEHLQAVFERLICETLRGWVELAEERLDVPCFVMPGNDDEFYIDDFLVGERVQNCDGRVVEVGPYSIYSLAWSTPTPWGTPRETTEAGIWERIERLTSAASDFEDAIFNFHIPPYASGLDWGPALAADLTPLSEGGDTKRTPIGSHSVRRAVAEFEPLLGLHGHVHESRGATRIGRTVCLNPGSRYGEGVVDGALVVLRDGDVASYQFVTG